MTQVLALAARQMEVGAPLHHHVGLPFKTASFNPAADQRLPPPPLRATPSRKRASGIDAVAADHGMSESLQPDAAGVQQQHDSQEIICLCTPAPKIPRPRNAFILYRQHHQSQVTADNPKLSNPDISKIIGERWKKESEQVKQNWKQLAEEEKQRHQSQYPNYRYQPRRGNKPGSWGNPSPPDEQGRCPKCNGRAITTPQTPSTPFATSPAVKMDAARQCQIALQRLDTAPSGRSSSGPSPTGAPPFPSDLPLVVDVDRSEPSPEMKRRRANDAGGYHAINTQAGSRGSNQNGGISLPPTEGAPPNPMHSYPPTPLPELDSLTRSQSGLTRSQSGSMPPPLQPLASTHLLDNDCQRRRHSGFDESLRLPPLQSSISSSDARHASLPALGLTASLPRRDPLSRGWTLRDMIMSISFKRKIAVLARICPPLPPMGGVENPDGIRGAFIAVEGPNAKLLQGAGNAIERELAACGQMALKVWRDDSDDQEMARKGEVGSTSQLHRGGAAHFGDFLEPYFKTISSWQKKSKQIGRHIAGRTALSSSAEEQKADGERVFTWAQSTKAGPPPSDDKGLALSARIPVALAKDGFSLTISERYACAMPITDMYAPIDHWIWMASLWRGTICPDLVVYVMPSEGENDRRPVEFSQRMGLIVVKAPAEKGLDEATGRRLAFEVMEWTRGGSFRKNLPRDWRSHPLQRLGVPLKQDC